MNWTGGRLHRHSKPTRRKVERHGKPHVPKTRLSLTRPRNSSSLPRSVSGPRAGPFEKQSASTGSDRAEHNQFLGSTCSMSVKPNSRREDPCTSTPVQSRAFGAEQASSGPKRFDTVKSELLACSDWLGLSVARPLQIHFTPVQERENIARHRPLLLSEQLQSQITPSRDHHCDSSPEFRASLQKSREHVIWNRHYSNLHNESVSLSPICHEDFELKRSMTNSRGKIWNSQVFSYSEDDHRNLTLQPELVTVEELQAVDGDDVKTYISDTLPTLDRLRSFETFDAIKALSRAQAHSSHQLDHTGSSIQSGLVTLKSGNVGAATIHNLYREKPRKEHITFTCPIWRPSLLSIPSSQSETSLQGNRTFQGQTCTIGDAATYDQAQEQERSSQSIDELQATDTYGEHVENDPIRLRSPKLAQQFQNYLDFSHTPCRNQWRFQQTCAQSENRESRFPMPEDVVHTEHGCCTTFGQMQHEDRPALPQFASQVWTFQPRNVSLTVHADELQSLFSTPFPRTDPDFGKIRTFRNVDALRQDCQAYGSSERIDQWNTYRNRSDFMSANLPVNRSLLIDFGSTRYKPHAKRSCSDRTSPSFKRLCLSRSFQ